MPVDAELCEYLEDGAIGTVGTDIFVGFMPAGVNGIVLTTYPGGAPEQTCGSNGWTIEVPRLQLRVRWSDDATAISKANACAARLSAIANQTIEGVYYRGVMLLQTPGLLYRDADNLANYGFNLEAEKAPS